MPINDAFKVSRAQQGSGWRLELAGVIDERFDPVTVSHGVSGTVIIDLDGVQRITSFGVREWIRAIRSLDLDYLGFVRARPGMVSQFNMIAGFGGPGELISLYAPFICNSCGDITEVLIDLRRQHDVATSGSMPAVRCSKCGGATEFDDLPESYFAHAASVPAPQPPPEARQLIDGNTAIESPAPFRVEKEVEGTVTSLWLSGLIDKGRRLKRIGDGLQGEVVVILAGVSAIEPDGLAGLKSFSEALGTELYFARVPSEIALSLKDHIGRGRVISMVLPLRCPYCRASEVRDASSKALSLLLTGHDSEELCKSCGRRLYADLEERVVERLLALPIALGSPAVRSYLASHPNGPTAGRVPSTDGTPRGASGLRGSSVLPRSPSRSRSTPVGGVPISGKRGRWFGEYEILDSLGIGGMGEVLLCRKTGPQGFEKKVVLKRILPQYAADQPRLEMFLGEARLAARLNHPNIVNIFDLGSVEEEYYIAMEYVDGWDLSKIGRRARDAQVRFPIELAVWIGIEIATALQVAQEHRDEKGAPMPIVHRDVSPENVLISKDGAVKLTDFGVAKVMAQHETTQPGSLKGKLGYMAPERLMGPPRPADGRVDIYAAGVILHECVAGKRLFIRETEGSTLFAVIEQNIPKLSSVRDDIPEALDAIMARALAKDPAERYASAGDMRHDLENLLLRLGRAASAPRLARWLAALFQAGSDRDLPADDLAMTTPNFDPPAMSRNDGKDD